ncbi:uncharacterized protein CDV56_108760 [Aspergillus thermomutatus]|uniref:Uncharacterized protein n=1 Tax=Aspergillus thermomutatus TaxID=41047 RepID=A0A397HAP4_ASPTH|nr:uncharacterized protein CDV56_108760 [Aspergillus thermomutatus]RHZ60132.1 hypothetical protein CDV56_108760 [Aspergillus thermomutatus]
MPKIKCIPTNPYGWGRLARDHGVDKVTVNKIDAMQSGSCVTPEQFLTFRVFWRPRKTVKQITGRNGVFKKDDLEKMAEIFRTNNERFHADFEAYLRSIRDKSDASIELGPFAVVREYQLEAAKMALIAFLDAVTLNTPNHKCYWGIRRLPFKVKFDQASIEARTDGYLPNRARDEEAFAIVETKARLRQKGDQRDCEIYMQESAEMVVWILKDKREGRTVRLNNQRLLVSQDRHKIYLTWASYNASYVDYAQMAISTDPGGATKHSQLWKPRLSVEEDQDLGM